jgi:putative flippase GtrA
MGPTLRRLTGEVARFSAVNVVATGVSLVLFNVITHGLKGWFHGPLNDHVITAYLLANSVGMFVSFYGSRHWAFRHRHAAGPGGGMLQYVAINLSSFVIPVTCLWVTRNVFGWDSIYADNMSGNVVGALLGNAFRFWAFRRFVFHTVRDAPRSFWDTPPEEGGRHQLDAELDEQLD